MKKIFFLASLVLLISLGILVKPASSQANTLDSKLSGRILLAVEAHGETWYVNPVNQKRYFIKNSHDTLNLMQQLGLGISNEAFNSFNGNAPQRLSGRILIKVESSGQAYYVNPLDLKIHYLGKPDQALKLMQSLSLGISNDNLEKIAVSETINVAISNYGFNPAHITISRGSMVTWTNNSNSAHTVSSPANFNFGEIDSGSTYSRMFNIVGLYNYYSINQSSFTGSIIVE